MVVAVLILISLVLFFLGFIVKQDTWGVGNYIAKDDDKSQCNIGYWITMLGVVMLLLTLIVYRLKKTAKSVRNSTVSAYGSARNSAASAYGSARNSAAGMFKSKGNTLKKSLTFGSAKAVRSPPQVGVELTKFQ